MKLEGSRLKVKQLRVGLYAQPTSKPGAYACSCISILPLLITKPLADRKSYRTTARRVYLCPHSDFVMKGLPALNGQL